MSNYLTFYYDGKLRNESSLFLSDYVYKDNKMEYSFILNGYNEYVNSGTYLEYEIANNHGKFKNRIDLLNPKNRFVGVGICTLTIIKNVRNEDKGERISYFMVHERNPLLTEHPGQKSVIPAGTFEPIVKSKLCTPENFNIENTVFREFGEEVLGIDDFTSLVGVELLEEGIIGKIRSASKTKYLGAGFDIMNGKLEMMGLLIIDAAKIEKDCADFSIEEVLNYIKLSPNAEGDVFTRKLTKAYLNQYANSVLCTPVARQIFKIVVENFYNKDFLE